MLTPGKVEFLHAISERVGCVLIALDDHAGFVPAACVNT
jgi:hypothetical protein